MKIKMTTFFNLLSARTIYIIYQDLKEKVEKDPMVIAPIIDDKTSREMLQFIDNNFPRATVIGKAKVEQAEYSKGIIKFITGAIIVTVSILISAAINLYLG